MSSPFAGYQQGVSYPASLDRAILGGAFVRGVSGTDAREGVLVGQADSNMEAKSSGAGWIVTVQPGVAIVGGYLTVVPAVASTTLSASGGSSRRDLIILRVYDQEESDGSDAVVVEHVTGTTTADPALPPRSIILAHVTVAASVGGLTQAAITDRRQFTAMAGGVVQVPGPATTGTVDVPAGSLVYDVSTDTLLRKRAAGDVTANGSYTYAKLFGNGTVYTLSTTVSTAKLPTNTAITREINNGDGVVSVVSSGGIKVALARAGLYTIDWYIETSPHNPALVFVSAGFIRQSIVWPSQSGGGGAGLTSRETVPNPQGSLSLTEYFTGPVNLDLILDYKGLSGAMGSGGSTVVNVTYWG